MRETEQVSIALVTACTERIKTQRHTSTELYEAAEALNNYVKRDDVKAHPMYDVICAVAMRAKSELEKLAMQSPRGPLTVEKEER